MLTDAPAIAEVQVSAWKLAYRGMLPDAVLDEMTVAQRTERWNGILAEGQSTTLVSLSDGELTGWIGFGRSRNHDRDPASTGEVYGLYVAPGHWRTGSGARLWKSAMDHLKQHKFRRADVWVLEANANARRFYEFVGCELDTSIKSTWDGDGFSVPDVRYTVEL